MLIHGEEFKVTAPYAEGHTLTAAEAKALNQTRAENIGNNFRKSIKEILEMPEGNERSQKWAAIQDEFAKYDEAYNFSVRIARESMDPLEREARRLVKEAYVASLKAQGKKLKDLTEEKQALLEQRIDEKWQDEAVIKQARTNLKNRAKTFEADASDLV